MSKIKIISNPYENKIEYLIGKPGRDGLEPITNENSRLLSAKLTEGVFSFNVKTIVDTIIDEYRVGNDTVFLQFEGTNDEYKELASVCADDEYRDVIQLSKSAKYLRNARDILPEVSEIFDLMQPLISDSVMDEQIEREKHQFKDVTKTDIPLCVLGNYSSGKSTFINALIGYEVLPSGDDPLTAKIHRIERSRFSDRASIGFEYKDNSVKMIFDEDGMPECEGLTKDDELFVMLSDAVKPFEHDPIVVRVNKALEVINSGENQELMSLISDMIDVTVPFNKEGVFGKSQNEFVIFDTPGSNAASNLDHIKVLKTAMENLSNGLPIYVSEYNTLDTTDNSKLCTEIKEMKELDSRFSMIIVNKADEANLRNYNVDRILNQAIPRQLYSGGLFFVSSIVGLGAKNDGCFGNEYYEDIYERIKDRFDNPDSKFYKTLYVHNIMAEQIKKKSVEESLNCPNRIFANSGLYWIEEEIETFAGKYSPYNKCSQSKLFLDKVIEIACKEIDDRVARKNKQKEKFENELEEGKKELLDNLEKQAITLNISYFGSYDFDLKSVREECDKPIAKEYLEMRENEITALNREDSDYSKQEEQTKESQKAIKIGKINKENVTNLIGNIKGWSDDRKELKEIENKINDKTSEDLLNEVRTKYEDDLTESQNMLFGASTEYWSIKTQEMKNSLADTVTGSEKLDEEKRKEISDIILTFEDVEFEKNVDEMFKKDDFERQIFALFGIKLFDNNKLNLGKLTKFYNKEYRKDLAEIYNSIKFEHHLRFEDWIGELMNKIRDNITKYNPELNSLSLMIADEEREIRDLENRKAKIEDYTRQIEDKMVWKTEDTDE